MGLCSAGIYSFAALLYKGQPSTWKGLILASKRMKCHGKAKDLSIAISFYCPYFDDSRKPCCSPHKKKQVGARKQVTKAFELKIRTGVSC